MYMKDFIYDDIRLSDHGCIPGSLITTYEESMSIGSVIELNTLKNPNSKQEEIINANSGEPLSCTFDVIKMSCSDRANMEFTDNELAWFEKWLCRKDGYHKFVPIYDGFENYRMCYYGTFTEIKVIRESGKNIGLTLTFLANAPHGFLIVHPSKYILNSAGTISFYNQSDELGYIYPTKFKITMGTAGTIKIGNDMDGATSSFLTGERFTEINNCVNGEVIIMDCVHKIITTIDNTVHPGLYNDFNYVFPRFKSTFKENINNLYISQPCTIEIEYEPIRKVGIIT